MLWGGRRRNRKLAELSLWCRELGLMLQNGTDPVAALSVLERQDFSDALRSMTSEMIEQAEADASIAELVVARADVFPPICIFALKAGQGSQRVPETLVALADCLAEAAELGMALVMKPVDASDSRGSPYTAGQAPVVAVVNRMLNDALTQGASQIELRPSENGESFDIAFEIQGAWRPIVGLPIDIFGPICRRICVMAQINWWSKEPALGTLTVEHRGVDVTGSVRFIPGDSEEDQQVYVTFRELPQG